MITYAGVSLLLEDVDGRVIDYANKYLATDDLRCFGVDPPAIRNNHLPLCYPNYATGLRPKINTLYWPTGASRWATGYFLADTFTLRAISAALVAESGGLTEGKLRVSSPFAYGRPNLDILDGSIADNFLRNDGFEVGMFMLPPRPISGVDLPARPIPRVANNDLAPPASDDSDPNALWIVPVVDVRYFWQHITVFPDVTSWTTLFDDIKTALGETDGFTGTYTNQGIPDPCTFGSRPDKAGPYFNAATLLDAMAHTLGRRVNTLPHGNATQTIALDQWTDASTLRQAYMRLIHDFAANVAGNSFSPEDAITTHLWKWVVPETLRIVFPKWRGERFVDEAAWTEDRLAEDFGFANIGHHANKVHYLNCCAAADFSNNGATPDNETDLDDLADAIATAFYGWMRERHDLTVPGILPWIPSGFDDYVEWSFQRLADGHFQGQTRVHSAPYNFGVDRLLHQFDSFESCGPACDAANAIHDLTIIGSPTSGTFSADYIINGVENTLTFDYDATASEVQTELETHAELASGDVAVTGGPFPDRTVRIEFTGDQKNKDIELPASDWSNLSGGKGVAVIAAMAQLGVS